jgi:hypothetical protein
MSRSFPVRVLAAVLLTLAVLLGGASAASASDATLKQKLVALDKSYEKKSAGITFPEDPKSPTFGAEYTAASTKLQGLLKQYRAGLAKERASSDRGRRARRLLLSSAQDLRLGLKALTPLVVRSAAAAAAGGQDAPEDVEAAAKIAEDLEAAAKDNSRAYKLLGLKAPKSTATPGVAA